MRTAARRDDNEEPIVLALQSVGCSVWRLSAKGIPDLLVGRARQTFLFEVKGPKGVLTPAQVKFRRLWKGTPPITVRSITEALVAVGAIAR